MAKPKKKKLWQGRPPVAPVPLKAPSTATTETERSRGLAAFQRGDYAEAIRAWQQVRRSGASPALDAAIAEARFRRALLVTSLSRRAQDLQEVVALAPNRAIYQFHLGLAYHRQGQMRRAVAAYEEAYRLAPDGGRIRHHLALALLAEPAAAERAREILAGAGPRDEAAVRLRALAALRANDPTAAVALLAERKASSLLGSLALGLAQLAAGQTEAATASLGRVRRSRQPLSTAARDAAALAAAAASLRAGKPDEAQKAAFGQDVPDDPVLRSAFATVARRLAAELVLAERTQEAIFAFVQARVAEPDHAGTRRCISHIWDVLGTQAARRGEFAGAVMYWEKALADQSGNVRLLRNLALANERLERWTSAGSRWDELIRLWKKELQAARRQEETAGDLRNRLRVAYQHLAGTYQAAGDQGAAARTLEQALNFDASDVDLRLRAAELYLENEQFTHAIEHLRRLLPARPNDTRVLLNLGSAYDLKGDDRQAEGYLQQALALEPGNPAITAALASTYHSRGHRLADGGLLEGAAAEFARAAELAPGDPEHRSCEGMANLRLGRIDAARAAFARALALEPDDPVAFIRIGGYYLEHGYEKEAEPLFRKALRLNKNVWIQMSIGLAYVRWGDSKKAEPYLKRVLKAREPAPAALAGRVLLEVDRAAEAIPYLEHAVALNPLDWEARSDLALACLIAKQDIGRAVAELTAAENAAGTMGNISAQKHLAELRTQYEGVLAELATGELVPRGKRR